MNDIAISATSIGRYLECPRQWYYSNIIHPRRVAMPVATALGQAVHSGIEAAFKGEPAEDALREAWAKESALVPIEELAADPDALPDALKMLAVYQRDVMPTFRPVHVEKPFAARVYGQLVTGTLDGADDDDVHDTKTTRGKTINGRRPGQFKASRYSLQVTLYACGFKSITGRWPKRLLLDVLTRLGKYRQYELAPDFGELRTSIEVVRDGLERRDFSPTGAAAGHCPMCPYRLLCPYSTVREATES